MEINGNQYKSPGLVDVLQEITFDMLKIKEWCVLPSFKGLGEAEHPRKPSRRAPGFAQRSLGALWYLGISSFKAMVVWGLVLVAFTYRIIIKISWSKKKKTTQPSFGGDWYVIDVPALIRTRKIKQKMNSGEGHCASDADTKYQRLCWVPDSHTNLVQHIQIPPMDPSDVCHWKSPNWPKTRQPKKLQNVTMLGGKTSQKWSAYRKNHASVEKKMNPMEDFLFFQNAKEFSQFSLSWSNYPCVFMAFSRRWPPRCCKGRWELKEPHLGEGTMVRRGDEWDIFPAGQSHLEGYIQVHKAKTAGDCITSISTFSHNLLWSSGHNPTFSHNHPIIMW